MVKKKSKSPMTKTKKTGILKGVGKYRNGKKTTNKIKGRGGFFEDVGGSLGPWLGKKADGLFNKVFGLGSYHVTKNTLTAQASDPPILSNTSGATRVQHREYIQDVAGSTAFTLQAFSINPGLSTTFPWLATVANCFEEYILHGIIFEFKSTSATALNSTNTALGTVIMATEYNALHSNFVAKRDMENYVYSTSSSPDESALHPIECARDVNVLHELYVRNSPPSLPTDLRFSDLGNFQIATVGMQASAVIGELWVTYDIELIKPRLPDAITSVAPFHSIYDSTLFPAGSVPTASNLFGAVGLHKFTILGTGVESVIMNGLDVSFPNNGRYIAYLHLRFDGTITIPTITVAYSNGAAEYDMFASGGTRVNNLVSPVATSSSTFSSIIHACDATNDGGDYAKATYSFGAGFGAGTIVSADLIVVNVPSGFLEHTICLSDLESITHAIKYIKNFEDKISKTIKKFESDQKEIITSSPQDLVVISKPPNKPITSLGGLW